MLLNSRNSIPAVRDNTCLAVHSSCEELLDDSRCLYYLENLPECRMNIAKGLSLLRSLEENEEEIYQSIALRSRGILRSGSDSSMNPEQVYFRFQDAYEKEKKSIERERVLLRNYLRAENRKLVMIEGGIFSLPEPHRSVMVARYIDRLSWSQIQHRLKRSASRIYALHKEGLGGLQLNIRLLIAEKQAVSHPEPEGIRPALQVSARQPAIQI
jgi:hypothetical protein